MSEAYLTYVKNYSHQRYAYNDEVDRFVREIVEDVNGEGYGNFDEAGDGEESPPNNIVDKHGANERC